MFETVPPGAQVVQKDDVRDAEHFNKIRSLDNPWQVGCSNSAIDDGASDAESCGNDALAAKLISGLAREFLDDALELREPFSGAALPENTCESATLFGQEPQVALRPPTVPSEDQTS